MAPATEIATIPLAAGAQTEDPSSPAGAVWKSVIDTILAAEGAQRAYWGRQVENPSIIDLLIDWDSVQAHKDFIASPTYGPFAKHLMTIIDGHISLSHANFDPHPPSAALSGAPVTERFTIYFSADTPEAKIKSFDENVSKFLKVLKENAENGFKAVAVGWVVEELDHEGVEGKAKALTGVIGWDSVEAHLKFRETPAFKENAGLLSEGVKAAEIHHVKFHER